MGYLTLVEVKLWDNPQARREVVGQIVEYAKDFSRWCFEDLDRAVREAGTAPEGILEAVRRVDPDVDEAAFIDTVSRGLARGAFLLLVVGNGIREGVESITEFLQQTPSLHFNLSLVELALYRTAPGQDWPLLIQPRTVARTAEVVRAVVEVRAPAGIEVQVQLPDDDALEPSRSRRTISEEAFIEQLSIATSLSVAEEVKDLILELQQLGLVPRWRGTGVSMRLPDPAGLSRFWTVIFLGADGRFWLGYLESIEKAGYPAEIWKEYLYRVCELLGLEVYSGIADATRPASVKKLLANRAAYLALAERYVTTIQNRARSATDSE